MDFETDEEIEEEMQTMMKELVIPMREKTGSVDMTAVLFPDTDNLPEDMRKQVEASGTKPCMLLPSVPEMGSKDKFYAVLSEICREMKVRNTFFFSDTWVVRGDKGVNAHKEGIPPSEHPDREDALLIQYVKTDVNGIMLITATMCVVYEMVDEKVKILDTEIGVTHNKDGHTDGYSRVADAVSNNEWA